MREADPTEWWQTPGTIDDKLAALAAELEASGWSPSQRKRTLEYEGRRLRRTAALEAIPPADRQYVYEIELQPRSYDDDTPSSPSVVRHVILSVSPKYVQITSQGDLLDREGHVRQTRGPFSTEGLADHDAIRLDRAPLDRDGMVEHTPKSGRAYWRNRGTYYSQAGYEALVPEIVLAWDDYEADLADYRERIRRTSAEQRAHLLAACSGDPLGCPQCRIDAYLGRGSTRGVHARGECTESTRCLLCFEAWRPDHASAR
jgi:hypothetical protein